MIYSESQKALLEHIVKSNSDSTPFTIIREIMRITELSVIEFIEEKQEINFYTSKTGDNTLPQKFIQCLVILDKLEKDNLIFIEKGNIDTKERNFIAKNNHIQLISGIGKRRISEPERMMLSFCDKYYDIKSSHPIKLCGTRRTNAYALIQKYINVFVYPTPELIEFVEKKFVTPEDFRLEKQLKTEYEQHKKELKWTRRTLLAAIFIPLITCCVEVCSDSNTYLMNKDLKIELIDTIHTNVVYQQSFEKDTSKLMSPN